MCDIFVKSYEDSLLKGGTEAALFSMTVRLNPSVESSAFSYFSTVLTSFHKTLFINVMYCFRIELGRT